ncbi:Sau3AI family type II restriction endonuclease [Ferruginibacter sp. HRS2-29]|uniref:Sau3AI family type II restriction endonuclease n=1 Tax=Ferruginibacter sp. HRS2-29 TaxID=2487334 RepID=UPI0020CF0388|nr:Sau3AI family type II restriction endonuclease [Ferruginibacter sp. HRS2-29]MCP9750448.1 DNA mismatch repair protein [Ferruginibacter sp. HRS2-29]
MERKYDPENKVSVIAHARKLINRTLRESGLDNIHMHGHKGKGSFGQVLEEFYFEYKPNSNSEPDFKEIGLELKASPLKKVKGRHYNSKERLVLNIINYSDIPNEKFETSSFWKKNANLLLVFYLYELDQDILDYKIRLVSEWEFTNEDLKIIRQDWEKIKEKILSGKAHELSEGDTLYLGACTKGGKGGNPRPQPFSQIHAKQRAFSLKQGYVNHIIASISREQKGVYGKLIKSSSELTKKTLEEIVVGKFESYYGFSIPKISEMLGINLNPKAKSFYSSLTKAILGVSLDKEIEEFKKADIKIRAVRLQKNNLPKEDISFPAFEYVKLVREEWETSELKDFLEHKFLFVFFQFVENDLILKKAKFWNMPHQDILDVEKVWKKTKDIVSKGEIVRDIKKGRRSTNFPDKSYSKISHVRPHASNAADTYPLPVKDNFTGVLSYTKHAFWFNSSYVRDEIYLK